MGRGGGGGGRAGGGGGGDGSSFSGEPGAPRAFAATVGGERLNTREFLRRNGTAQRELISQQRNFRRTSGLYRRLQDDIDVLADARGFDSLQRPSGTRLQIYQRAATVIDRRNL